MDSTTESAMIFVNGFPRYSEVVFMRVNASCGLLRSVESKNYAGSLNRIQDLKDNHGKSINNLISSRIGG